MRDKVHIFRSVGGVGGGDGGDGERNLRTLADSAAAPPTAFSPLSAFAPSTAFWPPTSFSPLSAFAPPTAFAPAAAPAPPTAFAPAAAPAASTAFAPAAAPAPPTAFAPAASTALVPAAGAGGAGNHEGDLDTLIAPLNRYKDQFHDSAHVAAAFVICTSSNVTEDGKLRNTPPILGVYNLFRPGNYKDGTLNVKIKRLAEIMRGDDVNMNSIKLSAFWDAKISEVVPLWKMARLGARNESTVAED